MKATEPKLMLPSVLMAGRACNKEVTPLQLLHLLYECNKRCTIDGNGTGEGESREKEWSWD